MASLVHIVQSWVIIGTYDALFKQPFSKEYLTAIPSDVEDGE
jgi:hypothetical protein